MRLVRVCGSKGWWREMYVFHREAPNRQVLGYIVWARRRQPSTKFPTQFPTNFPSQTNYFYTDRKPTTAKPTKPPPTSTRLAALPPANRRDLLPRCPRKINDCCAYQSSHERPQEVLPEGTGTYAQHNSVQLGKVFDVHPASAGSHIRKENPRTVKAMCDNPGSQYEEKCLYILFSKNYCVLVSEKALSDADCQFSTTKYRKVHVTYMSEQVRLLSPNSRLNFRLRVRHSGPQLACRREDRRIRLHFVHRDHLRSFLPEGWDCMPCN